MASRLGRMVGRITAGVGELEATDLQQEASRAGASPIRTCADREPATFFGTLRAVTLRPRAGVPSLEAELYDGSGYVTLVWLGRRRIVGVEPGRAMQVHGRVSRANGQVVMYNPRYVLVARDS